MKLKAYGWDDEDYDESHVVWAATPGKAKALLASEHENLQKCGFIVFRGLINMEPAK